MATWRDFRAFVKANYEVTQEQPDMLQLIFETENDRSQVVYLWYRRLMKGTEDWIIIESPFARVEQIDLQAALEEAGRLICGGVVIQGNFAAYRHAVPLANLDVNEFKRPLQLVTLSADRLEQMLFGEDHY